MVETRFLISKPMWGLANRLLALTSAMRLAERHQRPFHMDWRPAEECMAEFHDLFAAPLSRVRVEGSPRDALLLDSTGLAPKWIKIANVVSPDIFKNDRIIIQSHSMTVTNDETFTEKDPFNNGFALDMRKYFLKLVINNAVSEIINKFNDINFSNLIGVHIRRSSPKTGLGENLFKAASNDLYERIFDYLLSHNKNLRFYLSTNGQETEEHFINRFGDRILRYPKRSIDYHRETVAVQDALVDMILLSRTRLILRHEPSTFAYFATLIGHNPQLIIRHGSNPAAMPLRFLVPLKEDGNRRFQDQTSRELVAMLTAMRPCTSQVRP